MKSRRLYFMLATSLLFASLMAVGLAARIHEAVALPQSESRTGDVPAETQAAIRQAALDYIEGWYEGNAERMERAVHPELAKRIVQTDVQNRSRLDQQSALTLVQRTKARASRPTPKDQQQREVTILDVFANAASVRVTAADWVDYLHLAKFNGRWVIVNVLWELKPEKK